MNFCPKCRNKLQIEIIDSIDRYACSDIQCDFVNWDNPIPVVAGIVKFNGKYVLARNSVWEEGMFSMLTGFLERHELPEKSIAREVEEELGLLSKEIKFIGHFSFNKLNQLIIAYHIEAQGVLELSPELAEVKYVTEYELQEYDFGKFSLTKNIVNAYFQSSIIG